jgi:hypothetical protein
LAFPWSGRARRDVQGIAVVFGAAVVVIVLNFEAVVVFFLFFFFLFVALFLLFFAVLFLVLVLFFVFFFFEFFAGPGVVSDAVVGDGAGIDDDPFVVIGLELHVAEVERGGLEGVEEEAGDFGIELADEDEADDLHKGDLDGVGVLEDGHGEVKRGGGLGAQLDALGLPVLVKETKAASAKSRGATLGAIGFDMSATRDMNVVRHEECSIPLPHGLLE